MTHLGKAAANGEGGIVLAFDHEQDLDDLEAMYDLEVDLDLSRLRAPIRFRLVFIDEDDSKFFVREKGVPAEFCLSRSGAEKLSLMLKKLVTAAKPARNI